ncbi:MAG: response regulator [bacterium]|nr:MAG: response regulator [bacterium]
MKRRILIIDDEEGIRDLYRLELENEGYDVFTAPGSKEALRILKNEGVDLVILDIRLKGENGLELLQKMSGSHPQIPVIISSAYSSYRSDFSSWLAEGYVVKSTETGELLEEVKKVLRKFYPKGRKKV